MKYKITRLKIQLLFVLLFLSTQSWSQLILPVTSPYNQNFNTTPGSTGTSYPTGWTSYDGTNADATMSLGTSSSTGGANYNYSSRIGLLGSGSAFDPGSIVLAVSNTTGKNALKISYDVIKIREQGRSLSFNLEISTTSATSGFTAVSGGSYISGSIAENTTSTYSNIDISGLDNKSSTVWIRWYYANISGSGSRDGIALDNVVLSWSSPTSPIITTNTSSLTDFGNQNVSTSSISNSFLVSASNLTDDVTVTAPSANFEVSLDNINWFNSVLISNSGSLSDVPVYVRFTPQSGGLKNENITLTSTTASSSVSVSGTGIVVLPEPDNHVTNFMVSSFSFNTINLSWNDAVGTNLATGYYVVANTSGSFSNPVDGIVLVEDLDLSDGEAVVNILNGVQLHSFTNLNSETQYYFAIFPYSNNNSNIDYKVNGIIPVINITTDVAPTYCGLEDFSNSTLGASYSAGSFTGNNSVVWSYVESRDENNDDNNSGINGKALMLRRQSDNSKITSSKVENGIKDFSVKLYKGFTSNSDRQVELFVNGISKGLSIPFNNYNENIFTVNNINIEGSVIIEIRNVTGNQVIIDDITWTCYGSPSTTWNGTSWSNGIPDETMIAQIEGVYSTSANGAFNAKTVTVNSGSLTVNSDTTIEIQDELVNNLTSAAVVVENNGIIKQFNNVANTGQITVRRNSANAIRLDYTAWSSPVGGQNALAFSPLTLTNRFYDYDAAANAYVSVDPSTTSFAQGKGLLIRTPNNWPASTPTAYPGEFKGVPNNGNVTTAVVSGYNLLGNPYASPIDAGAFFSNSNNSGTLGMNTMYFWTHTLAASGGTYATSNYATHNGAGGTAAAAGGQEPDGIIQVGQGFLVDVTNAGSAEFNNTMRLSTSNGQFFKSSNQPTTVEKHRMWLDLTSPQYNHNQILVGYISGATNDLDPSLDAKLYGESNSVLYSSINNSKYVIQSRALPFYASDIIPLGLVAQTAGQYTISMNHFDGLFASQDIFLKDNLLNIVHDIKNAAYSFVSDAGQFDTRFEIVYATPLAVDTPTFAENSVVVFANDSGININAGQTIIDNVKVFDVRGRLLFTQSNINANAVILDNLNVANQVLILKIVSANKEIISKKVIN